MVEIQGIHNKIRRLLRDFNVFNMKSTGRRYWLDLRCLILISHLYIEYFLEILIVQSGYSEKRARDETFKWKINKLKEKGVFNNPLYDNLSELNDARNTIGHNLNIIGKLSNVNINYLDIKSTQIKVSELICQVSNLIKVK